MIVRPAGGVLHLITQPDHAALAGRIMSEWVPLQAHARRKTILEAIAEHDNGWREPDAEPTVEPHSGQVADFINAPVAVRQGVWPRAVTRLAADPWAAALVAQHALFVYSRFRTDADWHRFFAELEAARDANVRATSDGLDTLRQDYDFVRLGDLISLMFCTGWSEPQNHADFTVTRTGSRVIVHPDPFDGRAVPFEISALEVPDRRYASDADLRSTLREARQITLSGVAAGD